MLLSCKDSNLLVGNFMADFINNSDKKGLNPQILEGINLHKSIDHFTDNHQAVKEPGISTLDTSLCQRSDNSERAEN